MGRMRAHQTLKQRLTDGVFIVVGSALFAVSVVFFLDPHGIVPGGVTGLSMFVNHFFPFVPIGAAIFGINLPLLLLSWRLIGGRFLLYTLVGTVVSSALIDLFSLFPRFAVEPLMGAIFGGLLMGAGMGLVFSRGATTGGSDVAARLLKLVFPYMQMGRLILGIDLVIIALSGFVFGELSHIFLSAITLYISSSVMDTMLYGPSVSWLATIVSDKAAEIARAIDAELSRGATLLYGEGSYTKAPRQVLLCAVKRQQITCLKYIVNDMDAGAFVILTKVNEVLGEGFGRYDKNNF